MLTTILVGTDGSTDAMTAVEVAAALAAQTGVDVVLVHAMTLVEHAGDPDAHDDRGRRAPIEDELATTWSAPLRAHGVSHRCVLEDGPPLLVLPRVAEREGAELVVVASRGRGLTTTTLGSTAHGLLEVAGRPVLVVPTPGD